MYNQHILLRNKMQVKKDRKKAIIRKIVSSFFHATLGVTCFLLFVYALYTNGAEYGKSTETHTITATYINGMLVFPNGNQQGYYAENELHDGQTVEVTLNEYGNVVYVKGE